MASPDIAGEINGYNSIERLVQYHGGSTARTAAELGVTQRSVQRWLKGTHAPSRANQAKINRAGHPKGVRLDFEGKIAINGKGEGYERDRHIWQNYSNAEWERFSQLAARGDEGGINNYIAELYGVNTFEVVDGDVDVSQGNWQ